MAANNGGQQAVEKAITDYRPAPTTEQSLGKQIEVHVDMIAAHVIKKVEAIEKQCARMRRIVGADCAKKKAELAEHIERADTLFAALQSMETTLDAIEGEAARLIGPAPKLNVD